jgi:hypothetical protein
MNFKKSGIQDAGTKSASIYFKLNI